MRSRWILLVLSVYLTVAMLSCSKPSTDNTTTDTGTATDTSAKGDKESKERREAREEKKKEPLMVPAGTAITVSLGSSLGSKLSQSGQTFSGTLAKDVMVGEKIAIPKGAAVSGTVTDAKPLGKFAGGAVLQVQLNSITHKGAELAVQANPLTFSQKGKGKRTAVLAGGGAAVGGIIGALAGGGKGAAIGMAAGGGAGAGGAAFTGNKDIVLAAESALTFQLSQPLEVK